MRGLGKVCHIHCHGVTVPHPCPFATGPWPLMGLHPDLLGCGAALINGEYVIRNAHVGKGHPNVAKSALMKPWMLLPLFLLRVCSEHFELRASCCSSSGWSCRSFFGFFYFFTFRSSCCSSSGWCCRCFWPRRHNFGACADFFFLSILVRRSLRAWSR